MAAIVVSIFYKDSESVLKNVTVQAYRFADAVSYVEENLAKDGEMRNCFLVTSSLDIKAAMAKNSYQLSFYDKNGGISDNIYVFSDDFGSVSDIISQKGREGWRLNFCFFRDSEFINLI